jgi:hypothetical protein
VASCAECNHKRARKNKVFSSREKSDTNPDNNGAVNSDPNIESESESESEVKRATIVAQKKTGSRLPADWQPSDADRKYATDLGLSVNRTAEDFRGYWLAKAGKDAVKLDWPLTWQGWCRREAERRGTRPARTDDAPPPPPRFL